MVVAMQGLTQSTSLPLKDTPVNEIQDIIDTNLRGTLFVARAVLRRDKVEHLVLVGGGGTSQIKTPMYATYGSTKAAFPQIIKTLLAEDQSRRIHLITPGMTLTPLLMGGVDCSSKDARTRRIFNVLAETVETMGEWFVNQLNSLQGKTSCSVSYLTPLGVAFRFLRYPWMKNRLIDEETGKLIK